MPRRWAAEGLGTFAIVFFGCGAIATEREFVAVNAIFGLVVMAMIYAVGHISAAHFNPAVTIAFAAARRFPWRHVPGYIAAQCAGAVAASTLHFVLLKEPTSYGATLPQVDVGRAFALEALGTFFLMLVIISVATDKRVNGAVPGIAIGSVVALSGLFIGPITGNSLNPARSLGPALFESGTLSHLPLYILGPISGAVAAALLYEFMRGGSEHGQGAPNDLYMALEHAKEDV